MNIVYCGEIINGESHGLTRDGREFQIRHMGDWAGENAKIVLCVEGHVYRLAISHMLKSIRNPIWSIKLNDMPLDALEMAWNDAFYEYFPDTGGIDFTIDELERASDVLKELQT